MKAIQDDPSTTENEDELFNGGGDSGVGAGFIGGILLLFVAIISPMFVASVVIVGISIWMLLRYVKLRISVLFSIAMSLSLISLLFLMKTDVSFMPSVDMISSHNTISHTIFFIWRNMSWTIWPGIIFGSIAGMTAAMITKNRIHNSPELVSMQDEKYYHFRYKRTPLQMWKRRRIIKELREGTYKTKTSGNNPGFTWGIEEEPINPPSDPADIVPDVPISRFDDEAITHTMINGQTGSGKTVTMARNIRYDMETGKTIFIIDCKNDPKFAAKVSAWSHELGKNFYHFAPEMADEYRIHDNPDGPAFYDPLAHGNPATHTDMLLSTREWDANSAFYKQTAQSLLSSVFAVMRDMDVSSPRLAQMDTQRGNMYTFYEMVRNEANFMNAIMTISPKNQTRIYADEMVTALKSGRTDEAKNIRKAMTEYKGQMRGLMSSIGRYMVMPHGDKRKKIDVFKLAAEGNNVVMFSLNATKPTDMGVLIGSMICTDLTNMTSMRANEGQTNPVSIYVDEFQSLPPTALKSMMEKARSANIAITVAFQSIQQVTAASGSDALINSLIDTCSNFIIHAGANESTAEVMSKIIGKHFVNDYTMQRRNQQGMFDFNFRNRRNANGGKKQIEKYKIEPQIFQNLAAPKKNGEKIAEAIIIKKSSSDPVDADVRGGVAHKVRMIPPDNVITDDYFDPTSPVMTFDDDTPDTGFDESDGEESTQEKNHDAIMPMHDDEDIDSLFQQDTFAPIPPDAHSVPERAATSVEHHKKTTASNDTMSTLRKSSKPTNVMRGKSVPALHDDDLFQYEGFEDIIKDDGADSNHDMRDAGTDDGIDAGAVPERRDNAPRMDGMHDTNNHRAGMQTPHTSLSGHSESHVNDSGNTGAATMTHHVSLKPAKRMYLQRDHETPVQSHGEQSADASSVSRRSKPKPVAPLRKPRSDE